MEAGADPDETDDPEKAGPTLVTTVDLEANSSIVDVPDKPAPPIIPQIIGFDLNLMIMEGVDESEAILVKNVTDEDLRINR